MDRCVNCGQPTEVVCSCSFCCLCSTCMAPHRQASPEVAHIILPYIREDSVHPNFENARQLIERLAVMSQYVNSESESLGKMNTYRSTLP